MVEILKERKRKRLKNNERMKDIKIEWEGKKKDWKRERNIEIFGKKER